MVKACFAAVLCGAAFGGTVTYNYTGNTFNDCNGTNSLNGTCPANSFSDRVLASLTLSAPLGANLSSANQVTSPNLVAWMIGDALGDAPAFASTDANAASEITGTGVANFHNGISISTDSSGAISAWAMDASNAASGVGITSPTFIGGSGHPIADALVSSTGGVFWHLSNGFTGTWTQTLNGYQGGPAAAPVFLLSGSPVAAVSGSIGGAGAQEFYSFFWGGGPFSASASITGASSPTSYTFTAGPVGSFCGGGASQLLNSGDSFAGTIAISSLPAGQYCIGIETNSLADPGYSLTFNTPVSGVPEPGGLALIPGGLAIIFALRRARRA